MTLQLIEQFVPEIDRSIVEYASYVKDIHAFAAEHNLLNEPFDKVEVLAAMGEEGLESLGPDWEPELCDVASYHMHIACTAAYALQNACGHKTLADFEAGTLD